MSESTLPLAQVKAHLSELSGRVGKQHERVTVTVHGRPSAVLLAVDDLDSLEETIAILSDSAALRALADSMPNSRVEKVRTSRVAELS